ncbi:AraC family L-rhamnose operon regulatory protein RhaS [Wenyingzhuangia heitensis]|uniref:AraC family L-rhamnose operon regulatory protein RhaS n=1 Tax=Wenyingzhuangia heitensis TaxID=1487859 RepID=A0ABX0UAA7_9FLAO|nr:AraC family transcriptional regulator [Wenyingzhuangia heitensis]NIJ44885.1 AraC family L-rhamnose operon regulatory protein RhaS [Wenyingzhuangia heitensis]
MLEKIQPYKEEAIVYHADTCLSLTDAVRRNKVELKALGRFTYPGDRLDEDTIGLNSIGYWNASIPQDWGLDWHRNEGIEFQFLESGSMPYGQEGKEMVLMPNYLTVIRPWEVHRVGNPTIGMGKFFWFIIDLGVRRPHEEWVWPDWITLTSKDLCRLTTILRQNEKTTWKTDDKILDCFKNIEQAIKTYKKGNSASKLRVLINYLLVLMLELLDTGDVILNESLTDSSRSVAYFLKELDSDLSKDWTIKSMANSAGVGVTRLTHHCKKLTNLTPMKYLFLRRLEVAKTILKENKEFTVSEIAYKCGFSSSQYFSTIFKKYEKCTPKEYQQKIK